MMKTSELIIKISNNFQINHLSHKIVNKNPYQHSPTTSNLPLSPAPSVVEGFNVEGGGAFSMWANEALPWLRRRTAFHSHFCTTFSSSILAPTRQPFGHSLHTTTTSKSKPSSSSQQFLHYKIFNYAIINYYFN
jgi:hypothetical protein